MKKITHSLPAAMLAGAIELVTGFARAQSTPAEPPPQAAPTAPPSAVPSPTSHENADEQAELLLAGKVAHGGYGAPEMKLTRLASTTALLVGGQGAWLIGHSVMIGGGGWGSVTSVDAPEQAKSPLGDSKLQFGYGGFRAGYVFFPQRLVHVTTGLLIGAGGISLTERHADPLHTDETDTNVYRTASVFVLEPDVAVEVNLNAFMRAAIDVSYRYVGNSGIAGVSSSTLSALAGGAMLKFGSF